jgi:hypothetical protein
MHTHPLVQRQNGTMSFPLSVVIILLTSMASVRWQAATRVRHLALANDMSRAARMRGRRSLVGGFEVSNFVSVRGD